MELKIDILDERDGIWLGKIVILSEKYMFLDVWHDRPVVSKADLLKIVRERRPTLRCRDIDIVQIGDSFILN